MPLTPAIPRPPSHSGKKAPHLFEVLDGGAPTRPLARHSLAGIDEVLLCRGDGSTREGRMLRIGLPDRWMSTAHARLLREGDCFRVEDSGSTNGTFINGEPMREREIADLDALQVGLTHLVFRSSVPEAALPAAPHPTLVTMSPELAAELENLPAIARSLLPVVIGGETGTGKEVVAKALHELSGRRGAFVAVNCAAIAPTLLESELFGHRRGAFTGAVESRPGLVRAADGGTLFLDEIGDLPLPAQAALLRAVQEGEVLALGSSEPARVDLRVIAATHQDLEDAVATQRFRADLYARIAAFTLRLPPLRKRREDLGLLIAALLRRHGGERATLTAETGRALLRHRWPMNVRELEQCIATALVFAGDGPIGLAHLPEYLRRPAARAPAVAGLGPRKLAPEDLRQRDQLSALLREHEGNVAAVARVLGKARMQVHRWVKRFDLSLADYR
jgi:transcriptional regulator with GAF, ATPase, and Fis domain